MTTRKRKKTPPDGPQAIEDAQGTQHAPETPPDGPQAIDLPYTIARWKKHELYQCNYCKFDSFVLADMLTHIFKTHRQKREIILDGDKTPSGLLIARRGVNYD